MRFKEIKEAIIGDASLNSKPSYIDAVNELLKQNKVLQVGPNGEFSFQPNPGQSIQTMQDAIAGRGQNIKGEDTDQIKVRHVYKSAEIKKIAKGITGDRVDFNVGQITEGVHATAAFVRLTKRPSSKINLSDLYPIIDRLENNETLILKAKEVDSNIADEFTLTVSLDQQSFDALKQLDKIYHYPKISRVISNIIEDANQESGKYADIYEKNGKFDQVQVIGDGVSAQTETKTDINFENTTERKYKGYSIKAGSTDQIHQVGGGRINVSAEERFDNINKELFGVHGRVQLINLDQYKDRFIELWNSGKVYTATRYIYKMAIGEINKAIESDAGENDFIKNLINALKYWMRRDDEGVILKQFTGTKKGTYILDAEKLDEMQDKGLNLVAQMADTEQPTIIIKDSESKEVLVSIRAKAEEKERGTYFRHIINKGKLFVRITDVSSNAN